MAPGRKALRKVLIGLETTKGTAVPATTYWRGQGDTLNDELELIQPADAIGVFDHGDRSYIPKLFATLSLSETEATFEQLPYLFAMLYGGPTTGAADGTGGTGFVYATTIPYETAPTAKTFTVETGDDFEAEEMEYAQATKVTLTFKGGEAVKISADLQGRQVTRTTFTGSLDIPTVEDILASKGKLYLDAIDGTIGTTQVSNQVLSGSITFEGMWEPKYTVDGNLYFSLTVFTDKKISGEITFEHDTQVNGSTGEKAKWRAGTARLMRLQFTGNAYATPGTGTLNTGKKTLRIDLPIKWTKFDAISDQNGNDTCKGAFTSKYNPTAATAGTVTITNELDELP